MYIGQKEVKSADPIAEKYNDTIDLVKVTYADDSVETMTKKLYDVSATDQAVDLTQLRSNRCTPVVQSLLQLLLEWGIPVIDVNFVVSSIPLSINNSMNTANAKLWGKQETDLNLVEVDTVLKQKVKLSDILPSSNAGDSLNPPPPQG